MNVYRMRPAHPEFDWFEHNKNKRLMTYDSGERLAEFDDNGRGRWYYRNGRLALDYYDAQGKIRCGYDDNLLCRYDTKLTARLELESDCYAAALLVTDTA